MGRRSRSRVTWRKWSNPRRAAPDASPDPRLSDSSHSRTWDTPAAIVSPGLARRFDSYPAPYRSGVSAPPCRSVRCRPAREISRVCGELAARDYQPAGWRPPRRSHPLTLAPLTATSAQCISVQEAIVITDAGNTEFSAVITVYGVGTSFGPYLFSYDGSSAKGLGPEAGVAFNLVSPNKFTVNSACQTGTFSLQ
jgi:hypothetical protein